MILTEEGLDGSLLLVDGAEKTPLDDPELTALIRSFRRLQEGLDKDKTPEKVAELIATSAVRLLTRLSATVASRLQDLEGALGDLQENPPGGDAPAPEGVLLTIDECRLVVSPLFAAANTFGQMAQAVSQSPQDPSHPPREQVAASYLQVQEAIGMLGSRLALGLKAYELAAAEEAAAEAAEEAEAGGEDDEGDDEEDGENA
jgi:hypothetical protein